MTAHPKSSQQTRSDLTSIANRFPRDLNKQNKNIPIVCRCCQATALPQHSRPSRARLHEWCQWWNERRRGGDTIRRMYSSPKMKGASPYVPFLTRKQLAASRNYNVRHDCSYNHSKMEPQRAGSDLRDLFFSFSLIFVGTSVSRITDRDGDKGNLAILARTPRGVLFPLVLTLRGGAPGIPPSICRKKAVAGHQTNKSAWSVCACRGPNFLPILLQMAACSSLISLSNHLITRSLWARGPHLRFYTLISLQVAACSDCLSLCLFSQPSLHMPYCWVNDIWTWTSHTYPTQSE